MTTVTDRPVDGSGEPRPGERVTWDRDVLPAPAGASRRLLRELVRPHRLRGKVVIGNAAAATVRRDRTDRVPGRLMRFHDHQPVAARRNRQRRLFHALRP